jgi:hypothetical protein
MDAFSPADFPDAEEVRPSDAYFDLGGVSAGAPFTVAMNNVISRHLYEIRDRSTVPLQPQQWKRKFREFLMGQTNELLEFATKPLAKHPTLGPAEILIRKFSRGNFQVNHQSLREVTLDSSGVDVIGEINASLSTFESSLKGYGEQTRFLFDLYKTSGEAITQETTKLQMSLDLFDKIQQKIVGIAELQMNDQYEGLARATQSYLQKIFEDNKIEDAYKNLIEAYRKFFIIRDIVLLRRTVDTVASEPLCSICFQEAIQYVLTPCGHTFCGSCVKRQLTQCYVCRQVVKERVKLYIG